MVDLLKSLIGDVNLRELIDTTIKFMHQTVEHQRKIEADQAEIKARLTKIEQRIEDARLPNGYYRRSNTGS